MKKMFLAVLLLAGCRPALDQQIEALHVAHGACEELCAIGGAEPRRFAATQYGFACLCHVRGQE